MTQYGKKKIRRTFEREKEKKSGEMRQSREARRQQWKTTDYRRPGHHSNK